MQDTLDSEFYKSIKAAIALVKYDSGLNDLRAHLDLRYALSRHLAEQTVIGKTQAHHTKELCITHTISEVMNEMQQHPELRYEEEVFVNLVNSKGERITK